MRDERAVPASRKRVLFAFGVAVFGLLLGACNCDGGDNKLYSTECIPGDPEKGRNHTGKPDDCNQAGIDDNCSGEADELCDCVGTSTRTCSNEPNAGIGACNFGTQSCENGSWGFCAGAGHPSQEICDGVDNDCDGAKDGEDADLIFQTFSSTTSCWTGTATVVFHEHSRCHTGIPLCVQSKEICFQEGPEPLPHEICNDIDDDCDGQTDENALGTGGPCGPDPALGICQQGVNVCRGTEIVCGDDPSVPGIQPQQPHTEECNNKNDDCDQLCDGNGKNCVELIDEDLTRACGNPACPGVETCEAGDWVRCTAQVALPDDVCENGIDDDCDGQIDEDCTCLLGDFRPCFDQVQGSGEFDPVTGEELDCGRGIEYCEPDGTWGGDCDYLDRISELCNLGHNDDCNTATTDADALPRVCGTDVGECETGLQYCLITGIWENECRDDPNVPGVQPILPASIDGCDGLDNDCDGLIDEDVVRRGDVAMLFLIDESGSMCTYTPNVATALGNHLGRFAGTDHECAIAVVPGRNGDAMTLITPGFVTMEECQNVIATLGCNGGGREWNLDALLSSSAPGPIPWSLKFPYIYYIGDEPHQTTLGTVAAVQAMVEAQTTACFLPGCQPPACDPLTTSCDPGPPEVFVLEDPDVRTTWDGILNNTVNVRPRFYEITINTVSGFEAFFDATFTDVCP